MIKQIQTFVAWFTGCLALFRAGFTYQDGLWVFTTKDKIFVSRQRALEYLKELQITEAIKKCTS